MAEVYTTPFTVTLSSAYTAGNSTIAVSGAAPAAIQSGTFRVRLANTSNTVLKVTSGASTTTWSVTAEFNDANAVSGATVYGCEFSPGALDQIRTDDKVSLGELVWTAPPVASSWIQQNFDATYTSLTDFTSPVSGVRLKEAIHSYGNTNLARYALRPIVASHWSVKARLRRHSFYTNFQAWGIVVRDSASSKSCIFGFDVEQSGLAVLHMNSDTSYSGPAGLGGNGLPYQMNIWMRLDYDGTNCTLYISQDGVYWSQVVQYTSSALWGFLTNAATHYGVGYNANNTGNGNSNQEVDVLSWTETALA